MKISKYLMLLLLPALAHAQQGSHGGDTRCEEFYQLASQISISLAKLGQEKMNLINPLVDVKEIRNVLLRPVQVIPAHQLDRQALSNPELMVTRLDVEQWEKISKPKRVELVSHELLVLTGKEADGEYLISQDLLEALKGTAMFAEPEFRGIRHAKSVNGGTTFYFDTVQAIRANSSTRGVCKYISERFTVGRNVHSERHHFYAGHGAYDVRPVIIDENGVITKTDYESYYRLITQIECL